MAVTLATALFSQICLAQPPLAAHVVTAQPAAQAPKTLSLSPTKSQMFRVNEPVGRIAVSNSQVVDAVALTARSFCVLGKQTGTTNVSIYGKSNRLLAVIEVIVGMNVDAKV